MASVLTINGSPINLAANDTILRSLHCFAKGGIPTLEFQKRGGPLVTPDPWRSKSCTLTIGGNLVFSGDVTGVSTSFDRNLGWTFTYSASGLRNRADYVPVTDTNTGTDQIVFNLPGDDPDYIAARSGRTVGQIITAVLTSTTIAAQLTSQGIGNMTLSGGIYSLPASTVADLAVLSVIPQYQVSINGEKVMGAIEGFLQNWHPNHWLHIEPGSDIRILDYRSYTPTTLTLGVDLIDPPDMDTSTHDNFSRVVVRGQPLVEAVEVGLKPAQGSMTSNNGLSEAFAHDGLTNSQAKAVWKLSDFQDPSSSSNQATAVAVRTGTTVTSATITGNGFGYSSVPSVTVSGGGGSGATATATLTGSLVTGVSITAPGSGYTTNPQIVIALPSSGTNSSSDVGSCVTGDTLHVTVTSQDASKAWSANYFDQMSTGRKGIVLLTFDTGTGINQSTSRRIVANTALTAGGTCILTLDFALPATNYNVYSIRGTSGGASGVWRTYHVDNTAQGGRMVNTAPYPIFYRNSTGDAVTSTTSPTGSVLYSSSGLPPYNEVSLSFVCDPVASTITFVKPTVAMYGTPSNLAIPGLTDGIPSDVRALLMINKGALTATCPADSGYPLHPNYDGTSYTVDGLERTLYITVDQWKDPASQSSMDTYACDMLDSVKDTIYETTINYKGLYSAALTPGISINIVGNNGSPFTTGWETLNLPVVSAELIWQQDGGTTYTTVMHCSNRRASWTAGNFLMPNKTGMEIGLPSDTSFDWGSAFQSSLDYFGMNQEGQS